MMYVIGAGFLYHNQTLTIMSHLRQYQSEFESEFEMDSEAEDQELDSEYEYEDSEVDSEYEDNENEDQEYDDYEYESEYEGENDLESQLYEALNNEHESEFEFEQTLNEAIYKVEKDYFWKKAFSKVKSLAKNPMVRKLVSTGLNFVPGGAAVGAAISALPMDDVVKAASQVSRKGMREGLTKLATDYVQGKVPNMGDNRGNQNNGAEEEYGSQVSRGKIRDFLNIAETAYENMADEMAKVNQAKSPVQVKQILAAAPKVALSKAIQQVKTMQRNGYNGQNGHHRKVKRREIDISPRARVIVRDRKVIIIEP
jgi:hypothetical protein